MNDLLIQQPAHAAADAQLLLMLPGLDHAIDERVVNKVRQYLATP
jgi:hypothetical protein